MTDDSYREDDEEELVKKKKKESEKDDEKKKSVAFKATTSRASPRLNYQVMKTQALVIVMTLMRR
jgi:hypothetical protein